MNSRSLHKTKAEEFGNQPARVVEEAIQHHARLFAPEKAEEKAQAAVSFARDRLSERSAVFEHFEVIRDALRHAQGKIRLPEIQAELDRQREQGNFISVEHIRPHAPAARYTTPQLVAVEREAIERVRAGQNQMQPIASNTTVAEIRERYANRLNGEQQRLVHETLLTRDQIFGIQGGAGTGKTTALSAIKEIAEAHGYKALGLGPTSRAAKGLKEAGMEAETMQSFLTRVQQPDETGLASACFSWMNRALPRANRCAIFSLSSLPVTAFFSSATRASTSRSKPAASLKNCRTPA